MGENITQSEEDDLMNALHDWGSDLITDKIKELKGLYVCMYVCMYL